MRTKRTNCFLLFTFLIVATNFNSSAGPHPWKPRPKKFVSFNAGYVSSLFHVQQGTLSVSFPYQTTTADNVTTSHVFSHDRSNPFPRTPQFIDVCLQMGDVKHFADLRFAGNNMNEVLFTFGYGFRHQIASQSNRSFLKFSIDFGANLASRQLGTIDNRHVTIDVLGKSANPTFRYTHHGRYSQFTRTYDAYDLDIKYFQTNWVFAPTVALEWHPFQNKFHVELFSTYLISVANVARINMLQQTKDSYPTHMVENFRLTKEGLTVQYNGDTIEHSPFHFGGVVVGVRIGFSTFVKQDNYRR